MSRELILMPKLKYERLLRTVETIESDNARKGGDISSSTLESDSVQKGGGISLSEESRNTPVESQDSSYTKERDGEITNQKQDRHNVQSNTNHTTMSFKQFERMINSKSTDGGGGGGGKKHYKRKWLTFKV